MVKSTKSNFLDEVAAYPGGENILRCMQCGNCTASCPTADNMDYTPAEIIEMVRAGLKNEVLSSITPWRCLACYTCTARCPRGVKVTDLMHALQRLSVKYNKTNSRSRTPVLFRSFNESIYKSGRIPELRVMARYFLRTNPFRAAESIPVGWGLLTHGRLSFGNPGISPSAVKQVRTILDKAAALEGAR